MILTDYPGNNHRSELMTLNVWFSCKITITLLPS